MMKTHTEFCYYLLKQIDSDIYRTFVSDKENVYVTNGRWGFVLPIDGLPEGKWLPYKPSRKKQYVWFEDTNEITRDIAIKMKDSYVFDLRTQCELPERSSCGAPFGFKTIDKIANHLQYELVREAARQGLCIGFDYNYLLIAAKYSIEMGVRIEEFGINGTMGVIAYADGAKFCLGGLQF